MIAGSGEGIPPEFLRYVFEPFRQADATLSRRQGGLGLGLAICKQIVELHGGRLTVSSAGVGRGAEFRVRIPRRMPADETADPLRGDDDAPTSPSQFAPIC